MSAESDSDEPLSALKEKGEYEAGRRRRRKKLKARLKYETPGEARYWAKAGGDSAIRRPHDVWLYMKDLNPVGPYSCLLCSEWFLNRTKLIVHYILNHKKDYCGVCRYFVENREAWFAHTQYHLPFTCSQCPSKFETELDQRNHFREDHASVHCRFCYFMMPEKEYNEHLFQRHSITNVAHKDLSDIWETEYEGSPKFHCFLCTKSSQPSIDFVRHYMFYHRCTLKCFSTFLSGYDVPFSVYGVNVSATFMETLKDHPKVGYVEKGKDQKLLLENAETLQDNINLLDIIPEIKQELGSDSEERIEIQPDAANESEENNEEKSEEENGDVSSEKPAHDATSLQYKGSEDFDVTLTELVVMDQNYINYMNEITSHIKANTVSINSILPSELPTSDAENQHTCMYCPEMLLNLKELLSHVMKMHGVKMVPRYFCRLCVATFDSMNELKTHIKEELEDFDNLWLCQFCDIEFDGRENGRRHLNDHHSELRLDNCFSPQFGFKCRYCPTLFWSELDRDGHQLRAHFGRYKEDFYECCECSMIFGDKVLFVHHYYQHHLTLDLRSSVKIMMKCSICCLVFTSVEEVKKHFYQAHPEARKIFCSLGTCRFRPFSQNKSFKMHLQTFHGPNAKHPARETAACVVCGREFANSRACSTHMATAHGPGRFKCKLCGETLQSADERKLHFMLEHPGRHQFECILCNRSFQFKSSLYAHRTECHRKVQTLTCKYCSKQFTKKDSFRDHLLIHEGPRHTCSYCPMRFVQRSNMLRHQRRHTGERPYSCDICGRGFADKGACNTHMKTHGPQELHGCPYCGRNFHQKSKLKYHLRKHTGKDLESCQVCSKLFTSPYSLREHMKTHDQIENVECPICGRKYTSQRYFLRHMRTSHDAGADALSCPICNKTLRSPVGLRAHVLTHSNVKNFQCRGCSKGFSCRKTMLLHLTKKHGIKGNSDTVNAHFRQVDPRQLDLGLDEEALKSIFGRMKTPNNEVVITDYVTFPENVPLKTDCQSENELEENEVKSNESENGEGKEEQPVPLELMKSKKRKKRIITYEYEDVQTDKKRKKKKKHKKSKNKERNQAKGDEGDDFQVTDFVTVKIEPNDNNDE